MIEYRHTKDTELQFRSYDVLNTYILFLNRYLESLTLPEQTNIVR